MVCSSNNRPYSTAFYRTNIFSVDTLYQFASKDSVKVCNLYSSNLYTVFCQSFSQ